MAPVCAGTAEGQLHLGSIGWVLDWPRTAPAATIPETLLRKQAKPEVFTGLGFENPAIRFLIILLQKNTNS